ncbi:20063_t:CDS:2, partial [Racocetra persica]
MGSFPTDENDDSFLYYDDTTAINTTIGSTSPNATTIISGCDVACMKLWLVFSAVVVIALMLVLYLCVPATCRPRRRRKSTWLEEAKPNKTDVTTDAYRRAMEYIRARPPSEELPPYKEIQDKKGYSAWEFKSGGHSLIKSEGKWIEFFFKSTEKNIESMIQTNYPFFISGEFGFDDVMNYFEVTVKSMSSQVNTISIGLTTKPYPYFRLPGYHVNSIAYHSDDGRKFHSDPHKGGVSYSEPWGKGDTIGCGYRPDDGEVFFTKNGKFLSVAFSGNEVKHTWYPSVGTDGSCELEVNFGDSEFKYKPAKGFGP